MRLAADTMLSDVRRVTIYFVTGRAASHLMHADDVERFVIATKRLHVEPGVNPHNGNETSRAWRITVATLDYVGPFWWTTPDLQRNGDSRGAQMIDGYHEETLWFDAGAIGDSEAA